MLSRKVKNFLAAALLTITYMLPYPGLMPGHKLYRVREIFDYFNRFWAFGSFSQHKNELELADKKLVEARILFEYKQYPLAIKSLGQSNQHWRKAGNFLEQAKSEGKNISQKLANFEMAGEKHQEILVSLGKFLPEEFVWQPEKQVAQKLEIKKLLEEAIKIREFMGVGKFDEV